MQANHHHVVQGALHRYGYWQGTLSIMHSAPAPHDSAVQLRSVEALFVRSQPDYVPSGHLNGHTVPLGSACAWLREMYKLCKTVRQ